MISCLTYPGRCNSMEGNKNRITELLEGNGISILAMRFNSLKLTHECNDGCNCDTVEFLPTCLRGTSGQQTYFSPCHAGCTEFSSLNGTINYNSCKCAAFKNLISLWETTCEKDFWLLRFGLILQTDAILPRR